MARLGFLFLLFIFFSFFTPFASAEDEDIVILKEGGMYKGEIISQTGSSIKMKVKGKVITIRRREIRKIIAKERPIDEYKRRAKEIGKKDAEAHYDLALWCEEKGLKNEAEKLLKVVVNLEPDHAGARRALGFGFYEGAWLEKAKLKEMGLVSFEGQWIKEEELGEAIRKGRETRLAGMEARMAGNDEALDAMVKDLEYTYPSLKLQGDILYSRFARDRTRLFVVREPMTSPLGLPSLGLEASEALYAAGGDPVKTLEFLVDRAGAEVGLEGYQTTWTPPEGAGNNLYAALWSLAEAAGKPYEKAARDTARVRAEKVPAPFRDGLANLINHFTRACLLRKAAFQEVVLEDLKGIVDREAFGSPDKLVDSLDLAKEVAFMERYPLLAEAARVMMQGVMEFVQFVEEHKLATGVAQRSEILKVETPFGLIFVGGLGQNYYEDQAALIVDLGGDDTYQASLGSSACSPEGGVGLLLDLKGDDEYIAKEYDAFGSGHFGVGLHFDLEGKDRYSTVGYALGSAFMGCGLLYDGGGDDTYECGTAGEGWGVFGCGLLIDKKGKDSYTISRAGQGFGGTLGIGLLLDLEGEDDYHAMGGGGVDALNPETSACFAQGAAKGHWPREKMRRGDDSTADQSVSGGWGLLVDLGGDDLYEATSYAQGAADWSGLGMLLDRWGNDTYKSDQIAQGAAFNLASGLLLDCEGDDQYTLTNSLGQGCALNFSVGMLIDCFGTDHYTAQEKSMGYVLAMNCLGVLLDAGGDDRYDGSETSFGFAEGYNSAAAVSFKTLGLFLDLEGEDIYRGREEIGNNKQWTQEESIGAGVDREGKKD